MARIEFPDVPSLPGVPDLVRSSALQPVARGALGILQGAAWKTLQNNERWGIYSKKNVNQRLGEKSSNDGFFSLVAGEFLNRAQISILSFHTNFDTITSDFPVEKGSFASYNKVIRPQRITLTYAVSGPSADKMYFFNALRDASKSNTLFDVWMPETYFSNYTITGYNFDRTADSGAYLFIFDVSLTEVKEVTPSYSSSNQAGSSTTRSATKPDVVSPKKPTAATPQNVGKSLPEVPEKGVLSKAVDSVVGWLNKGRDAVIEGNKKYR